MRAIWNPYLDGRPIKEPEWSHVLFSEGKGIMGEWKRDFLNGKAMMLKEDGTYVYGEWSFGRLKKDTERPLTNEEREDFDKRIHKLETSISLICP